MGFAWVMLGILLLMSVVLTTAINYGIAKDSQIAPLRAENTYAAMETEKAHSGLTVVDTCLAGSGAYVDAQKGPDGPYTLWLTVKDNGSTVLNPRNFTVFFNSTYFSSDPTPSVNSINTFEYVFQPLESVGMAVPGVVGSKKISSNLTIYNLNYPYSLMVVTSNGVKAIAPTAPTNFSGYGVNDNHNNTKYYVFNWSAPISNTGIAYYLLYDVNPTGNCPPTLRSDTTIIQIQGNTTTTDLGWQYACPGSSCPNTNFYMTAVDNNGNMGVQSVTLNCNPPTSSQGCNPGYIG